MTAPVAKPAAGLNAAIVPVTPFEQNCTLIWDRETKRGSDALGSWVTRRCLELGLHMNVVQLPGMGGVFRIAPPLTSTEEELAEGLRILDQALTEAPLAEFG